MFCSVLITTYQKPFILESEVQGRVDFDSLTLDPGSMPGGGARGQNLVHFEH